MGVWPPKRKAQLKSKDNIKWENYPLIQMYDEETNKWDDAKNKKYNQKN